MSAPEKGSAGHHVWVERDARRGGENLQIIAGSWSNATAINLTSDQIPELIDELQAHLPKTIERGGGEVAKPRLITAAERSYQRGREAGVREARTCMHSSAWLESRRGEYASDDHYQRGLLDVLIEAAKAREAADSCSS